jgi:hypothetical protein
MMTHETDMWFPLEVSLVSDQYIVGHGKASIEG